MGSDHHKQLRARGLRPGLRMQSLDRIELVPVAPVHAVPEGERVALCGYEPRQTFDAAPWDGSMWSSRDRCPGCVEASA